MARADPRLNYSKWPALDHEQRTKEIFLHVKKLSNFYLCFIHIGREGSLLIELINNGLPEFVGISMFTPLGRRTV